LGYGFDGQKHSEGSGYSPNATNNDMELEAAIQGLTAVNNYIEEHAYEPDFSNRKIQYSTTLVSDSQLVLGWASGKYAFRQQDKIDKFKQLQLLVRLMDVQTRWVKGHTGDEHNDQMR
jgi:ribonuclease HI